MEQVQVHSYADAVALGNNYASGARHPNNREWSFGVSAWGYHAIGVGFHRIGRNAREKKNFVFRAELRYTPTDVRFNAFYWPRSEKLLNRLLEPVWPAAWGDSVRFVYRKGAWWMGVRADRSPPPQLELAGFREGSCVQAGAHYAGLPPLIEAHEIPIMNPVKGFYWFPTEHNTEIKVVPSGQMLLTQACVGFERLYTPQTEARIKKVLRWLPTAWMLSRTIGDRDVAQELLWDLMPQVSQTQWSGSNQKIVWSITEILRPLLYEEVEDETHPIILALAAYAAVVGHTYKTALMFKRHIVNASENAMRHYNAVWEYELQRPFPAVWEYKLQRPFSEGLPMPAILQANCDGRVYAELRTTVGYSVPSRIMNQ
jgi:hypothetical protein